MARRLEKNARADEVISGSFCTHVHGLATNRGARNFRDSRPAGRARGGIARFQRPARQFARFFSRGRNPTRAEPAFTRSASAIMIQERTHCRTCGSKNLKLI